MKAVKIIFGAIAAIVTIGYLVQFIGGLAAGNFSTWGITDTAADLGVLCIGAAITVCLFQSAFKRR